MDNSKILRYIQRLPIGTHLKKEEDQWIGYIESPGCEEVLVDVIYNPDLGTVVEGLVTLYYRTEEDDTDITNS